MSFKIAFIGAGSLVFARTLFTDIISVPEFHDIEIAFTDINPDNLEKTRELCQRDLDANNIPIKIEATTNRRDAFKDARYIVNCVRIGGLEGFETDARLFRKSTYWYTRRVGHVSNISKRETVF